MTVFHFLHNNPVCYVTWDIERALGLPLDTPGYFIIANATPFAKKVANGHANVLLLAAEQLLTTAQLLEHPAAQEFIAKHNAQVLVYINNAKKEQLAQQFGFELLNPQRVLSDEFDQKISQTKWLAELQDLLPAHTLNELSEVVWDGEPFVLHYNMGFAGNGTFFITQESELQELQRVFPRREVRVSEYIEGFTLTNNNVVTDADVLIGALSYQINGQAPFYNHRGTTIGNDWGVVGSLLTSEQHEQYKAIVRQVGAKLQASGWRGLFGIDCLVEASTGKLFLIEINARQPASATYESALQLAHDATGMTVFGAHVAALLGLELAQDLVRITAGAQIVVRQEKNKTVDRAASIARLAELPVRIIEHYTADEGSEIIRVQSQQSIMQAHNEFSDLGKNIIDAIQIT